MNAVVVFLRLPTQEDYVRTFIRKPRFESHVYRFSCKVAYNLAEKRVMYIRRHISQFAFQTYYVSVIGIYTCDCQSFKRIDFVLNIVSNLSLIRQ